MYQVNYNGLKRRDTYDEIVAILENDPTILKYPDRVPKGSKRKYPHIPDAFNARLKYPNRIATQIMNSPYMKQLDAESILDVQRQQDRLSKEKLKEVVIKAIADYTGMTHNHTKAVADKEKKSEVVPVAQSQLVDLAKRDDDTKDFASVVSETLSQRAQDELDRSFATANGNLEKLDAGVGKTPIHHHAVAIQAKHDAQDRGTQMTPYRQEQEMVELTKSHLDRVASMDEMKKYEALLIKLQRKIKEKERARQHTSASSSGIGNIAKDLGGVFSSVASGIGYMLAPSSSKGYTTPTRGRQEQGQTPPEGSRSRDGSRSASQQRMKSEPRSVAKSEVKSEISSAQFAKKSHSRSPSQHSGMALPVTPGNGESPISVKSEMKSGMSSSSKRSKSREPLMALPVTPGNGKSPSAVSSTPASSVRLKKDGSPDKRFKGNK